MRGLLVAGIALAVAAVFFAGAGFIIGATEHPWHDGWKRAYRQARTVPGFRRIVAFVEARETTEGRPPGLWAEKRTPGLDAVQQAEMERLAAIGYLEAYEESRGVAGVTIHAKEAVSAGVNLMNSGNAPEAWLRDMDGNDLHRWRLAFADAFPGREVEEWHPGQSYWRRVHLHPDGGLLAIFEGLGLVRLDRDSNLLWALECGCHHDLWAEEGDEGRIWVLDREPVVDPRLHEYEPVLVDYVLVVSAEGEVLRRISIADALLESHYASILKSGLESGDVFHTNTIERLDGSLAGRLPAFRAGSLLISMRELDAIAVLDPDAEKITWLLSGAWHRQHQPTMVGDGRMLIFDNRGHAGRSKVLEFDPTSQQVFWEYLGTAENDFSSRTSGSVQRLPNGNTLVTESDSGRAFEVTADGRRVWEYNSPERGGENDELVATLQEVQRFPEGYVATWLR